MIKSGPYCKINVQINYHLNIRIRIRYITEHFYSICLDGLTKTEGHIMTEKIRIPKSEKTKQNILTNYLILMENKKWDKISVKELCLAAEITRGTFYQYYFDIYDLMEQIQNEMFADFENKYSKANKYDVTNYSMENFEEDFDCNPHKTMIAWFSFCLDNSRAIKAMLDPKYGDKYFVKKLKKLLSIYINDMMDKDGFPRDELRDHFTKLFIEMHFLATRSWLNDPVEKKLSIEDIIHLLNTTRIGANYLRYLEIKNNK